MQRFLFTTLAALACTGTALAADKPAPGTLRIESEAQFQRDHGRHATRMAPGVYLMTQGELSGKKVAIGAPGLAHDLALLRKQLMTPGLSNTDRKALQAHVADLEKLARQQATRGSRTMPGARASQTSSFGCWSYDNFSQTYIYYPGFVDLSVGGGLYKDRGDGNLNWYYARLQSTAIVNVYPPSSAFWHRFSVSAAASATNVLTGQTVNAVPFINFYSAGAGTGYIYSGPSFGHHLKGRAVGFASGDCFTYVSLEDVFQQ
ncbi:MAG: hypothetical protein KF800_19415 [Lysobacter sp.]|nr:hypothetical protein [Lysobacter sp.]